MSNFGKYMAHAIEDLQAAMLDPGIKKMAIDSITSVGQQLQGAQAMSGISFKASDMVSGGGLLDDSDATILSVRAAMWDYNGNIPVPVPALRVTYLPHSLEGDLPEVVDHYSAGDAKNLVPSEDGRKLVPVGSSTGLNESTNAALWVMAVFNAGFPEDKVGDDLAVFDGMKVYVKRMPKPKRPGLTPKADSKGDGKVLTVQKIHSFPWDAQTATVAKTKKVAAPKPPVMGGGAVGASPVAHQQASAPTAAPMTGDLNDAGMEGLLAILSTKGAIAKAALAQEAFKQFQKHPQRNLLVQLLYSDDFLNQEGAPWKFDGTTVSL